MPTSASSSSAASSAPSSTATRASSRAGSASACCSRSPWSTTPISCFSTTGLDPQSRRNFWRLIDTVRRQGKTVVLTTHYMEEASQLCDTVAIVDRGRLIAQGAPAALVRDQFPGTLVRLPRAALPGDGALPEGAQARGETIEICTADAERTMHELLATGVPLRELQVSAPTLEDVFLALTGHGLRG
jgi:ABC-2 type transport system ATP-binding protein